MEKGVCLLERVNKFNDSKIGPKDFSSTFIFYHWQKFKPFYSEGLGFVFGVDFGVHG